mmetsp:Transcript_1945/g.3026  ORF Transcript_1945/g.3026 Transcript_1945/m.3026 type:complete len:261 (-) Transcript_1945:1211-1993(-)
MAAAKATDPRADLGGFRFDVFEIKRASEVSGRVILVAVAAYRPLTPSRGRRARPKPICHSPDTLAKCGVAAHEVRCGSSKQDEIYRGWAEVGAVWPAKVSKAPKHVRTVHRAPSGFVGRQNHVELGGLVLASFAAPRHVRRVEGEMLLHLPARASGHGLVVYDGSQVLAFGKGKGQVGLRPRHLARLPVVVYFGRVDDITQCWRVDADPFLAFCEPLLEMPHHVRLEIGHLLWTDESQRLPGSPQLVKATVETKLIRGDT